MNSYETLLLQYRNDPLINKIEEAYNKWRNHNSHKKIVKRQRNIYILDLDDKFIKFPNILFECLLIMDFSTSDCYKLYMVMYRYIQRHSTPYMLCKKSYLEKISNVNHMTCYRAIEELKDKKMLLEEKTDNYEFKFMLNVAPLTWNLSEKEREEIEKEVDREIRRLDEKWIEENIFQG